MNGPSGQIQADSFPERETIRRALRGDTTAFHEVVVIYGRRLYAIAYAVVQDPTEAEDVVQETFLKAYSRRWMIRDPDKFPAWLCRTARNQALDVIRKHRPQSLQEQGSALEEIADAGAPCPSAQLAGGRTKRGGAPLAQCPADHHRIAITLRFMEGMDYREIEAAMGLNRGALRGILARAMKTLRKGLSGTLRSDLIKVI
ncbi:MAG: RNA polymerase sigma factor [Chthoniobacter sp.]